MTYSIDLRKLVVEFVSEEGSKAEASRRSRVSLYSPEFNRIEHDFAVTQQNIGLRSA